MEILNAFVEYRLRNIVQVHRDSPLCSGQVFPDTLLVAGIVQVHTQSVRCVPQTFFDGFNVYELWHNIFACLSRFLGLGYGIVKAFEYVLNNVSQTLDFVVRQLGKFLFALPFG